MNWLIVKNDLKRNKVINFALLLFMMFSAALLVSTVLLAVQTFTSISNLYKTAEPAHFVQMHKGEYNQREIDEFMSTDDGVTSYQTVKMINVHGDQISIIDNDGTYNLANVRHDISLIKQNEDKDLLLNANHEKVVLQKGEIGIPVFLKETNGIEIGDTVLLSEGDLTQEFVVKEFVLDSMMNSSMASSTRVLISDEDYEEISGQVGEYEYLIEAYFTDKNNASDFQTAYENAGLPQNGPVITYTIIFLLSALTDIITVFVLLLVSILLIIVSFICVRFTVMATLEEEVHEIGTMKAIGLPFADIRNIYLNKYRLLALVAVVIGFIVALSFSSIFTNHISTTFGAASLSPLTITLSVVVAGLVYLLNIFYCKNLLKKINKVTVVDALVIGEGFGNDKGRVKHGLYKSRNLSVNWLMGLREVFYRFRSWIVVFAVVVITKLIILVPINLVNTMENPEFITYMGSSLEDILIEVENGENLVTGYENVKQVLENDEAIESVYEFRRVRVQTTDVDHEIMNLHIDVGENSGNDLHYLSGNTPIKENEIALSFLNAEKIGKTAGDMIELTFNNQKQEFMITGIYQDVTGGGYSAKAIFDFTGIPSEKYTFSVNVRDDIDIEKKADEWSEMIGLGVSVDPMEEFINQTLGGVVNQLKTVLTAIVVIAAGLMILITVLYLKLRLAKDLADIAVLKAIGFSALDIKKQYMIKIGLVSLAGLLVGILLTDVLGEKIVNGALSMAGIGIKQIELITNPLIEYFLSPLILLGLILLVTWTVINAIEKYNIISTINN